MASQTGRCFAQTCTYAVVPPHGINTPSWMEKSHNYSKRLRNTKNILDGLRIVTTVNSFRYKVTNSKNLKTVASSADPGMQEQPQQVNENTDMFFSLGLWQLMTTQLHITKIRDFLLLGTTSGRSEIKILKWVRFQ